MGQSLVKNYIHITFSTKHRQQLILPTIEGELYQYLGGICKRLECPSLIVGGYVDHIHILCLLSQKIALMKLMEGLKSSSSKWIKTKGSEYSGFYWQDGYGAFSISHGHIDRVTNYIRNQKIHHQGRTFQDEFRELLHEYHIEYDERYVWD